MLRISEVMGSNARQKIGYMQCILYLVVSPAMYDNDCINAMIQILF